MINRTQGLVLAFFLLAWAKDPVVDLVVAAADQWARDVDWHPHGAQP